MCSLSHTHTRNGGGGGGKIDGDRNVPILPRVHVHIYNILFYVALACINKQFRILTRALK